MSFVGTRRWQHMRDVGLSEESRRQGGNDDMKPGWGSRVCPFCHMLIEYCDCGAMKCYFPSNECCREWCEDQGWNIVRGNDRSCAREKSRV
jgi:hypothetical protein